MTSASSGPPGDSPSTEPEDSRSDSQKGDLASNADAPVSNVDTPASNSDASASSADTTGGNADTPANGKSTPSAAGSGPSPPEEKAAQETLERRRKKPLAVDVTWHNFERFKNRYSEDDGLAIIEVLRGHQHIAQEITNECNQRIRSRTRREPGPVEAVVEADDYWIQRVRIQSPQLIRLLSRLTGHRDSWIIERPRVFFQPFRTFYYYLPQMHECLKILEEKWGGVEAQEGHQPSWSSNDAADADDNAKRGSDPHNPSNDDDRSNADLDSSGDDKLVENDVPMEPAVAIYGDLVDSPITLSHVRKYVEFVEEHIVPRWNQAAGITKRKVRFNELYMSFKTGELLYLPQAFDSKENTTKRKQYATKMYQCAWMLYSKGPAIYKDEIPDDADKSSDRCLDLHCYYIDYDGTSYVPVTHTFTINHYEGEKDITSLEIYPLRFVKDADKIKAGLLKDGQWFREAVRQKHLYYDGWTLPYGPTADIDNYPPAAIEHVDSEVIIDFVEGFKSGPAIAPGPPYWSEGLIGFNDSDWPAGNDDITIKHWERAGNGQFKLIGEIKEMSQTGEWFCGKLQTEHEKSKALLRAHRDGIIYAEPEDDDLVLLPRRVVAYVLRERKFVMLDIRSLKSLPPPQDVFRDLKIDEEHKLMIKSLVEFHLKKQAAQKRRPNVNLDQDLIRGKGSGLFILLHGVPGVGKTATAEAVAQANKKPLFTITCGDLGFSPKEVESALREIFRLAHHWDCILLLDEADIFLSRRELGDLKRNALVSVFLRVLEYYSGVLFLTTNRVGTLDEAFKSRIHMSIYYPPLTKEQTLAIFEVNIRKVQKIEAERQAASDTEPRNPLAAPVLVDEQSILDYAAWHFDVHEDRPEMRWNGRQIRNAFQIAYSLAQFDKHKPSVDRREELDEKHLGGALKDDSPPPQRVLHYRHFEMVADAIETFEAYLYFATGGTDKDKAAGQNTRADDFDPHGWERKHVYRNHPPRTQAQMHPLRPKYHPPHQRAQYTPPRHLLQVPGARTPRRSPSPPPPHLRSPPSPSPSMKAGPSHAYGGQQSYHHYHHHLHHQQQHQQQQQQQQQHPYQQPPSGTAGGGPPGATHSGYSGWNTAGQRTPRSEDFSAGVENGTPSQQWPGGEGGYGGGYHGKYEEGVGRMPGYEGGEVEAGFGPHRASRY